MKRLIIYCSFLISISLTLSFIFYIKLNEVSPFQRKLKGLDYCFSSEEFNNIIFVGGSRVITHINPEIIDSITGLKSTNVSITDIGIVECNMLLNKYLQNHPKPDIIFLNIDVNMFFTSGPLYNVCDFIPYLKDSVVYNSLRPYKLAYRNKAVQYFYLLERIFASTDFSKSRLLGFNKKIQTLDDKSKSDLSFFPVVEKWTVNSDIDLKNKTIAANQQEGFDLIKEIINRCKQDSIDLKFIYSPIYYEGKTHFSNFNEIFEKIRTIALKNNVEIWDYSDMEICKSKNYFHDLAHLNSEGAKIYSNQIAVDIKKFVTNN